MIVTVSIASILAMSNAQASACGALKPSVYQVSILNVIHSNIYIAPIQGVYLEELSVLAYMMLKVIMNDIW